MPKAASTFEAEYLCDYAYHAQMEPLNGVASVSPAGDSAEVWCGRRSLGELRSWTLLKTADGIFGRDSPLSADRRRIVVLTRSGPFLRRQLRRP
jgi:hypothetical protein